MKIAKYIIGGLSIVMVAVLFVIYLMTKNNQSTALAIATYYPENVTKVDVTVTVAWAISMICTLAAGALSIRFADSRKMEVPMIIFYAAGFLAALMYSLLVPCLLWVAVLDFIALMFSVSYTQLDKDYAGVI